MEHPFGLFWPISAFSLSGITRQAERDAHQALPSSLFPSSSQARTFR
jgi:hypothetical protein